MNEPTYWDQDSRLPRWVRRILIFFYRLRCRIFHKQFKQMYFSDQKKSFYRCNYCECHWSAKR